MGRVVRGTTGLALLIAPAPACADWVKVATETTGAEWHMDGSRITRDGSRLKVWVKIDYSKDSTVRYRTGMRLLSVICSSQKMKLMSYTDYDSYGKIVASQTFEDSSYTDYGYKPVTPESVGETIMELACALDK